MHSLTLSAHAQRGLLGVHVRVSVRPSVRPSVRLSDLFGDISLLEPSIAPQTILRIQRSIKVGKYVGFFMKLLLWRETRAKDYVTP